MSAMPGWLTRILTDADTAGDVASTLILAADDLEDGTATTVDLRRWGHEIRGDMRDNTAELAQSVPPSPDVLPVVWRVTDAPTGSVAQIGNRYRVQDGAWQCWQSWAKRWVPSLMFESLAEMLVSGYLFAEEADPVPAVSEQEATRSCGQCSALPHRPHDPTCPEVLYPNDTDAAVEETNRNA